MARRIVQVWKKEKFQDNDMFVLNQLHTAAHSYEDPVASNPFTLQELQEDLPELDETAYAALKRKPRTQDPDDADPDQDQHEFVDDTQRERCRAMLHSPTASIGWSSQQSKFGEADSGQRLTKVDGRRSSKSQVPSMC